MMYCEVKLEVSRLIEASETITRRRGLPLGVARARQHAETLLASAFLDGEDFAKQSSALAVCSVSPRR